MVWIRKDPEVVETVLEDGAVFLNLRTKFYYSLNTSGYRIWQLLEFSGNSDELIQRIMAEYEAEDAQIGKIVSDFLKDLEREQLVIPKKDETDERHHKPSADSNSETKEKIAFIEPDLIKHDEPLHEVSHDPFDPQLPLAE